VKQTWSKPGACRRHQSSSPVSPEPGVTPFVPSRVAAVKWHRPWLPSCRRCTPAREVLRELGREASVRSLPRAVSRRGRPAALEELPDQKVRRRRSCRPSAPTCNVGNGSTRAAVRCCSGTGSPSGLPPGSCG